MSSCLVVKILSSQIGIKLNILASYLWNYHFAGSVDPILNQPIAKFEMAPSTALPYSPPNLHISVVFKRGDSGILCGSVE